MATLVVTPLVARKMKACGFVKPDMNKKGKPEVPLAGISVVFGFVGGMFLYVFLVVWLGGFSVNDVPIVLAILCTALIIGLIGVFDDFLDISRGKRVLMTFLASVPLASLGAGKHSMVFPFFGEVRLGLLYPSLVIPLGVMGAANGFNMLAGLNGLEAGMGIILALAFAIYAKLIGEGLTALYMLVLASALLAFLLFNRYPAKAFGGNTLTYFVGTLLACAAVTANMEKFALLCFGLYYLEFVLKAKGKFRGTTFGVITEGGTLDPPRETHSLTHIVMKLGKLKEWQVVVVLWVAQSLVCALAGFLCYYRIV